MTDDEEFGLLQDSDCFDNIFTIGLVCKKESGRYLKLITLLPLTSQHREGSYEVLYNITVKKGVKIHEQQKEKGRNCYLKKCRCILHINPFE